MEYVKDICNQCMLQCGQFRGKNKIKKWILQQPGERRNFVFKCAAYASKKRWKAGCLIAKTHLEEMVGKGENGLCDKGNAEVSTICVRKI